MVAHVFAKTALALQAIAVLAPTHVAAQQFEGDTIPNSLGSVPGAEKAFFRIIDKRGRNFTQINYSSYDGKGKRLDPQNVQRVVIFIHGLQRDPGTYMSNLLSGLAQTDKTAGPDFTNTQIIAPYFPNGDDKGKGYPWDDSAPKGGYGSTSNHLVWQGSGWIGGDNNQYPRLQIATSSYDCVDQYIKYYADKKRYPNLRQIVVGGHSAGAQFVNRYASIGYDLSASLGSVGLTYWIGNPNTWLWLDDKRPLPTTRCPDYNDWRMGLDNYTQSYNKGLVDSGPAAVRKNYQSKSIAYVRGLQDRGDDSSDCAGPTEGGNRDERFFNFIAAFPPSCAGASDPACDTIDYVDIGHDAGTIFASKAGQQRLFIDNFNGKKDKKPDFYCPRQQKGDSPFPDSSCNDVVQPPSGKINGMSYQGCWVDNNGGRSFAKQLSDSSSNTIDSCTQKCADAGYKLAGMEFGTQCFCGNELTSKALPAIERGCFSKCAGNDDQICGGYARLSVWGTERPTVLAPPTTPEKIRSYKYAGCYKDNQGSKAMPVGKPGGSLDKCASSCAGYTYFGTEYANECTCANAVVGTGNIKVDDSDCDMPCSGDNLQYCGGSNRLTLYSLNGAPVVYQGSGSSSIAQSASTVVRTVTDSSSGSAPSATSIVCPDNDGATYTSKGQTFTVQCGVDHAAGDFKSLYAETFADCMDACANTDGCVVLAYSPAACYLKNSIGTEVKNGVWGAIAKGASSSTSSSVVGASSVGSLTTSAGPGSPTSSASPTPALTCPDSDGKTVAAASGSKFKIECGTDHIGGDMPAPNAINVNSLQACVETCAARDGCKAAAFLGAACYLKGSVGDAIKNAVWGAVLLDPTGPSPAATSTTATATNEPVTSTTGSATASSIPTAPVGYDALGCFNTNLRALTYKLSSNDNNKPSTCADSCSAKGYKYSGVEYGAECWCGNTKPSVTAPITECNMACTGDKTQKCGSGYRANVLSDPQWKQTFFARQDYKTWNVSAPACYQASSGGVRTLTENLIAKAGSSNVMNVAKCLDTCASNNFSWCGLEWQGECWGSKTKPDESRAIIGDPLDPTVGCVQPCGGNATEACGGWAKVIVYRNLS